MSELRRDREWEHWPERRQDGGIRRHLRDLFSPTLGEDEIEQTLAAHAYELEMRAGQLAETVAELERREERTRDLRSAVEQMLRRGSAELDERHAELTELAGRLSGRESDLAESEAALTERRRELGAVELRRAAVERREETLVERERELELRSEEIGAREQQLAAREQQLAALDAQALQLAEREAALNLHGEEIESLRARVDETLSVVEREQQVLTEREAALLERERDLQERERTVAGLEQRERELHTSAEELRHAVESVSVGLGLPAEPPASPVNDRQSGSPELDATPEPALEYVALVLADGRYRLVTREDGPPVLGAEIVVDGATHKIVRVGVSPLPGDRRRCALAEPVAMTPPLN
jgi:DNA repair exonuclease SbcCD ATPase subunit